jgi:peptidoglycan/xylan/chitin deacetylase (PgdA/CDA1 family)
VSPPHPFSSHTDLRERWRALPGRERVERPGAVALSFDDGPDPAVTPALLDALDAAGARATFFVVGEQLLRTPTLGGEIVRRGHEVALHGFGHPRHDELPAGASRDDLAKGHGAVEAATGRAPRFFRPPYGEGTEATKGACERLALEPVHWSAWGFDWEPIAAEEIAELVSADLAEGTIVVLHDSARYAPREDARPTVEAVGLVTGAAAERGLSLLPVGECLVLGC